MSYRNRLSEKPLRSAAKCLLFGHEWRRVFDSGLLRSEADILTMRTVTLRCGCGRDIRYDLFALPLEGPAILWPDSVAWS